MRQLFALLPTSLLALSCAAAPAPTPAPPPAAPAAQPVAAPESPFLPTPFTAEQIRAACPAGRTLLYVVEQPDKLPVRQRMRFLAVDDERATYMSETLDEADKLIGESQTKIVTWDALRKHGEFPKQTTTIELGTAETPAGSFACKRYVVREAFEQGERVRKLCFADALAGPPVEITVEQDGKLVSSMTLVSNVMPEPE